MIRIVTLVLIGLGVMGLFSHMDTIRDARLEAAQARERELAETWQNLKSFEEELQKTLSDVRGGLSLAKAAERIEEESREHFPAYLANLHFLEKYSSLKEQVAHNIIRHFQVSVDLGQGMPEAEIIVNRLEKELTEMFPDEQFRGI